MLDESSGTSNFHFFLRNDNSSGTNLAEKSYGSTTGIYEASFTPNTSVIWLGIYLNNSATAATATAKLRCMIRSAAITDDTFVPYAKTNRELTVAGDEDRAALIQQVDSGAKNLLDFEKWANAVGVVHGDKSVQNEAIVLTAMGDSCNTYWTAADFPINSRIPVSEGQKLVLSWNTDNKTGIEKGKVYIFGNGNASSQTYASDISGKLEYTVPPNVNFITWRIGVNTARSAIRYSNMMICTATDYAVSPKFVPYAPTNMELYETKVTLQQVYGDAILIPAESDLNSYTSPGTYYALVANVPTIANTPYTATGFRVVVEKNTPSGLAVFQTIYPTSRTHLEFYRRVYEGGSWSSWYKFEGTVVS